MESRTPLKNQVAIIGFEEQELYINLTQILQRWHYEVKHVAIDSFEPKMVSQCDVVLLDTGPDAALTTLKTLKANEDYAILPVIAVIAASEIDTVERFLQAGAEDYLLLPFSQTLVNTMVGDFIAISQQRQDERAREKRAALLKIERDVQIARQIQLNFLPRELPQPEGWDIAAFFQPARQVAGDWYDAFYMANKRRIGFIVADVCDKGVGSALFMALFRSLIRAFSQQNLSLRWVDTDTDDWLSSIGRNTLPSTGTMALTSALEITNDYMLENHAEMSYFATIFFGSLDPATGTLAYANCGHLPAILVNEQGSVEARLNPTGPAVGMFPNVEFGLEQVRLKTHHSLLVYSDGVPDARSDAGVSFSEEGLLSLVQQPATSASMLLNRIENTLKSHIGDADQFDDITMMSVHRF